MNNNLFNKILIEHDNKNSDGYDYDFEIRDENETKEDDLFVDTNIDTIKEYINRKKIIFCNGKNYYYSKDDGYYKPLEDEDLKKDIAEHLIDKNYKDGFLNNLIKGIRVFAKVDSKKLNPTRYLNFKNCLFNLETYEIENHSSDIIFLFQLPVIFDEDALCERFMAFLDETIPDNIQQKILQEYVGYALSSDTQHHIAAILLGSGSNGKSTFLKIIEKIFGHDNIASVDLGQLGDIYHRTTLVSKLINISTEMNGKISKKSLKTFKEITSFERITARYMRHNAFSFIPIVKCFFASNVMPIFPESNYAVKRRLLLIKFPNQFSVENGNIDINLINKLALELSGICNWAIEGLIRLRENGRFSNIDDNNLFSEKNYTVEEFNLFISECCLIDNEARIQKKILYEFYRKWCDNKEYNFVNDVQFGKYIINLNGISSSKSNGLTFYKGINLI